MNSELPLQTFYLGWGFEAAYAGLFNDSQNDGLTTKNIDFIEFMNDKKYTMKFTLASSRVIGTWTEFGLLGNIRDGKGDWSTFSLVDLIWIKIIQRLRAFGVPLKTIEIARNYLITGEADNKRHKLEFFTYVASNKLNVRIILLATGEAHFCLDEHIDREKSMYDLKDFVELDFNNILSEVFTGNIFKLEKKKIKALTEIESSILALLKNKKYSKIEIAMQDGSVQKIDVFERVEPDKRIGEIINEVANQDVTFSVRDNNVVFIQRTVKQKVK